MLSARRLCRSIIAILTPTIILTVMLALMIGGAYLNQFDGWWNWVWMMPALLAVPLLVKAASWMLVRSRSWGESPNREI
jgi:hypothetical protein